MVIMVREEATHLYADYDASDNGDDDNDGDDDVDDNDDGELFGSSIAIL